MATKRPARIEDISLQEQAKREAIVAQMLDERNLRPTLPKKEIERLRNLGRL